ncbi:unnamed protein product [Parascedosporium putredinis]|uniref:Uncharacterized protein n=1 Tax=Parascedosporium putredinis TaxID=1442378 RepID=A0A9P1GUW0_9PEZI|nr:unnamed protein product [Parascedosporium putredinis]CAI7988087.1 unnamed protein product [Parascedosporium putredinis]
MDLVDDHADSVSSLDDDYQYHASTTELWDSFWTGRVRGHEEEERVGRERVREQEDEDHHNSETHGAASICSAKDKDEDVTITFPMRGRQRARRMPCASQTPAEEDEPEVPRTPTLQRQGQSWTVRERQVERPSLRSVASYSLFPGLSRFRRGRPRSCPALVS